jgi:hypothetical protein
VSKNVFGENDKQWLLTAFEKRSGTASDSSIDIKSEPEGKQNGTAPLPNSTVSDTNLQNNSDSENISPTNPAADGDVQSGVEPNDAQGKNNGIREAPDTGSSEAKAGVKKISIFN